MKVLLEMETCIIHLQSGPEDKHMRKSSNRMDKFLCIKEKGK